MPQAIRSRPILILPPGASEAQRVLIGYLLMVLLLQCLLAWPHAVHGMRHTHRSLGTVQTNEPQYLLPFVETTVRFEVGSVGGVARSDEHAHGKLVHKHGPEAVDIQPLGESADDGVSAASLLWAVLWPMALTLPLLAAAARFTPPAAVRFKSRSAPVPQPPPQRR